MSIEVKNINKNKFFKINKYKAAVINGDFLSTLKKFNNNSDISMNEQEIEQQNKTIEYLRKLNELTKSIKERKENEHTISNNYIH